MPGFYDMISLQKRFYKKDTGTLVEKTLWFRFRIWQSSLVWFMSYILRKLRSMNHRSGMNLFPDKYLVHHMLTTNPEFWIYQSFSRYFCSFSRRQKLSKSIKNADMTLYFQTKTICSSLKTAVKKFVGTEKDWLMT